MSTRVFRGRPRYVRAIQFTGKKSQHSEVVEFVGESYFRTYKTLPYLHEGNSIWRQLYPGDYIVKDWTGSVYACSPETFALLYEEVFGHNHVRDSSSEVLAWVTVDGRIAGSCPQCIHDVSIRRNRVPVVAK